MGRPYIVFATAITVRHHRHPRWGDPLGRPVYTAAATTIKGDPPGRPYIVFVTAITV